MQFHGVAILRSALVCIAIGAGIGAMAAVLSGLGAVAMLLGSSIGGAMGACVIPVHIWSTSQRDWRACLAIVALPVFLSAQILLEGGGGWRQYVTLAGLFTILCATCRILPVRCPKGIEGECENCGYPRPAGASICPECGRRYPAQISVVRNRRTRVAQAIAASAMAVTLLFVSTHVGMTPELPNADLNELGRALASNDMQRSYEASKELARREPRYVAAMSRRNDPRIRLAATRAARWIEHQYARPIVSERINDSDVHVRLEAVWAIQHDLGKSFVDLLEARRPHENSSMVLQAIDEAIADLSSE